jgi:hypothetical protein
VLSGRSGPARPESYWVVPGSGVQLVRRHDLAQHVGRDGLARLASAHAQSCWPRRPIWPSIGGWGLPFFTSGFLDVLREGRPMEGCFLPRV